jgi:hypothetical protein
MKNAPKFYEASDGFIVVDKKKSPGKPNPFKVKTSAGWAFLRPAPYSEKEDLFLHEYDIFDGLHYPKKWISKDEFGRKWSSSHQSPIIHVRDDKTNLWTHWIGDRQLAVKDLEKYLAPKHIH